MAILWLVITNYWIYVLGWILQVDIQGHLPNLQNTRHEDVINQMSTVTYPTNFDLRKLDAWGIEEKVCKHILPTGRGKMVTKIPWDPKKYTKKNKHNTSKANGSWKLSSSQLSERIGDFCWFLGDVFSWESTQPPPKDAIGTTRMTTYIFLG